MSDPVADLHQGLKELAAEDRDGWVALAHSDRVRDLAAIRERAEIELIRTVAEWDRHTAWAEDGAVTAVAWLKHDLDMPQGQAFGLVHLAAFTPNTGPSAKASTADGCRSRRPGCC